MLSNLARSFERYRWDVQGGRRARRRVIATVLFTARGRASGAEVTNRLGYWWTFRDGRAVRAEWFRDPEAARAAAGLADG